MSFRSVFVAVFLGTALIVAAVVLNHARPESDTSQPTAAYVKATGKCASCHRNETASVVHQYETSRHAEVGMSCLDCHAPAQGQTPMEHKGFTIAESLTSKNCANCHATQYDQFLRSRHALPAYAAVRGIEDVDTALVDAAEKHHPGAVRRPANALSILEGPAAITSGCIACHSIGQPNEDGSVGSCTECHSRHAASVEVARHPQTCGQCHMGPDHSQLEIYNESKHGILFAAQHHDMNLAVSPGDLTTADMPVPTCATCHMSGLDDLKVTHDTTERLSWFLFAPISEKRPHYERGQLEMKEVCNKCHAKSTADEFYAEAEDVVAATNAKVADVASIMAGLREDGLLTPEPFDEPIEFKDFDFWHYFGRTAKHGAFMGGADFVQWHGNYELLLLSVEIKEMAAEIREKAAHGG
jgi:hydroxylamine dehydrogenase